VTTTPPKPLPTPDEASTPFFAGAAAGRLMLMRCTACGAFRYPSRDRCDTCWSTESEWTPASGQATLHSWVIFHQVYHPAFAADVPYNVAVVELAEGPRITTNIVGVANDALHAGMPLEVVFETVADGVALPKFAPRSTQREG
jgi:uncharacterized OB-fold protein